MRSASLDAKADHELMNERAVPFFPAGTQEKKGKA